MLLGYRRLIHGDENVPPSKVPTHGQHRIVHEKQKQTERQLLLMRDSLLASGKEENSKTQGRQNERRNRHL
ncbi:hypothetical protein AVEN_226738-1, partial [Araneus ventricosus]